MNGTGTRHLNVTTTVTDNNVHAIADQAMLNITPRHLP